jgi:hypothetical protein
MSGGSEKTYNHSPLSKCSPGGNSANFSRCSGRNGSEMACSSLNHFPRSTSLQRREQNGPLAPANQSPTRLHVGHLTFIATKNNTIRSAVQSGTGVSPVRIETDFKHHRSHGICQCPPTHTHKLPRTGGTQRHHHFGLSSSVTLVRSAATAEAFSDEAPPPSKADCTSFTIASF